MKKQYTKPAMETVQFDDLITLQNSSPTSIPVDPSAGGSQAGAEGRMFDLDEEDNINFDELLGDFSNIKF